MKAKIFGKLKQEYYPLGLGDEILMSLAESLADTGLVTDENLDAVVACQRKNLEGLQKANDRRVNKALEEERKRTAEETRKKEEAEAAKAAEAEAARKAKEKEDADAVAAKAEAEVKEKEEADAAKAAQEEIDNLRARGASDAVIDFLKTARAQSDAKAKEAADKAARDKAAYEEQFKALKQAAADQQASFAKMLEDLKAQTEAVTQNYNALKTENEAAKAAKAKADREAFILNKARELGVPQWRIDEGFSFDGNATEAVIAEKLTTVASNIKTSLLPGAANTAFPKGDSKPSAEEIAALASKIVK